MITPYFLRCKTSDFPEMIALGKALRIIAEYEGKIYGIEGNDWDLVFGTGHLYEGTGVFVDVEGVPTETKRLIVDEDGDPLIHANILVRFDLAERAAEIAAQSPEMAAALQNLGKYFVADGNGKPRRPNSPQCVFAQ